MAAITKHVERTPGPFNFFEPTGFIGPRWFAEFERFFNRAGFPEKWHREGHDFAWMPDCEVFERNNQLMVRLDAPGLTKEDISVNVTDNTLTIEGERKLEKEEEKNHWYTTERAYGRFYRAIPLPQGVHVKQIKATFTNGVLEIVVPRPAAVEPAKHTVEVHAPEAKVTVAA